MTLHTHQPVFFLNSIKQSLTTCFRAPNFLLHLLMMASPPFSKWALHFRLFWNVIPKIFALIADFIFSFLEFFAAKQSDSVPFSDNCWLEVTPINYVLSMLSFKSFNLRNFSSFNKLPSNFSKIITPKLKKNYQKSDLQSNYLFKKYAIFKYFLNKFQWDTKISVTRVL